MRLYQSPFGWRAYFYRSELNPLPKWVGQAAAREPWRAVQLAALDTLERSQGRRDVKKVRPAEAPPATPERATRLTPEVIAKRAVARRSTTPSGRVSYTLTLALPRDVAERLMVRALREEKSIAALVAEILEAESQWP